MSGNIYIVHSSELLSQGLKMLLETELKYRVFAAESIDKILTKYPMPLACNIFLLPVGTDETENVVSLQSRSRDSLFVGISFENNGGEVYDKFDHTYSIFDPFKTLIDLIQHFTSTNSEDANDDDLTQREREVLRLIALGYTNKGIAETLFISAHTVISHRKNITEKLGIKSISGLTVYAIIQKIISPEDLAEGKLQ